MRYGYVNRKVGYVFQRDTVFPWRTVEANIYAARDRRGAQGGTAGEGRRTIEAAGLAGFDKSFPRMLGGCASAWR